MKTLKLSNLARLARVLTLRLVRWWWIRKHKGKRGTIDSNNGKTECIVKGLAECPFIDDAILIDYIYTLGSGRKCWAYNGTAYRKDFSPNTGDRHEAKQSQQTKENQ